MAYKVLLIDDEPNALEGLLLLDWASLGFEVCGTCGNGRDGLLRMQELEPDLVITDIHMPLMNGLEMIRAWRSQSGREIKFVILSGYSEFEYAQTAIRYGISHYLLKPIFPEEAAEELEDIRRELEQAERGRMMNELVKCGETTALLKRLLLEQPLQQSDARLLSKLNERSDNWKVCLVEWEPEECPGLREKAALLLAGDAPVYLLDQEEGQLCVICGISGDSPASFGRLDELRREYPGAAVYIAAGAPVHMLERIADSLQTARIALQHYFYQPEASGLMEYEAVYERPFSSRYDHIRLTDALMSAVNTLDVAGFRLALETAEEHFRVELVAPEAVRKFAIHLQYRMLEAVSDVDGNPFGDMLADIRGAGMRNTSISLSGLMGQLASFGEAVIGLLVQERQDSSHGTVGEINRYIGEHYREALTIQKLAEIFYLHPVYLGQLLIKKNGMNFNEQLHGLRIGEAARLLREQPQLKLSEISERVGYANYSQFLKQFEKKMKMGPNEYRHAKT
ncbi:response regulator [Paenibacillus tepidiphilus]|uniref:response regulator n=1 Tax=Paenibacillus tepidiphilus TaxID=2608683 RepID=UPI00123AC579|nr:response regulator [Paenibacillus tepidiphilus]